LGIFGLIGITILGGGEFGIVNAENGIGYDFNRLTLHVLVILLLTGPELAVA
jgi:hypothetical protein